MIGFVYGAGLGSVCGWSMKVWTRGMPPPGISVCEKRKKNRIVLCSSSLEHAKTTEDNSSDQTIAENYHAKSTVRSYVRNPDERMQPAGREALELELQVRRLDEHEAGSCRKAMLNGSNLDTRAVHGGERDKGGIKARAVLDAITTPVSQSATFTFRNSRECIEYNEGLYESFEYGRYGNPTTRSAEEKLMLLEGAEDALLSSSGMNSVTTMLLALVPSGGHIVVTTDCYRRTRQFVQTLLPKMGIRCTVLDPADIVGLQSILESDGADLYFSESPTNPMIRVVDVDKIAELCNKHNTLCCIDTTFATAFNFRPIEHGAHLVLHSGTKYLAGHNDVLCGALAGRADLIGEVRKLHGILGGVLDPHSAYLLLRGMKTLGLRIEQQNKTAATVAQFLDSHPKISRVHYPTLPSHPDYETAKDQFGERGGFGGVLSFEMRGNGDPWSRETFEAANRFVDALRIPYIGPSLGGVESLVEQVCIMGYYDQPLETRKALGINNGFIRFACGIENTDDVIADISAALEAV
uniref:Cystathionine gamma-synthase n=1 Tax=Timspurckia oligopyrenoides TaxID=708627 RepID=A0A7S0ZCY3_9RHOD|mmetsp:Transcript_12905/g.23194  ORF Transcript_12905/g.23194 Transcript_12905/m.23194 type:complete len:523 (+) Transcript_12905:27-1595(+)|eukprot:CAMPEP_0182452400 /NCGR_PEP_ID=MMETSP1172-20130603/44228_1 /TAXON_ID=708627 /ORGANISM="Timspurckia oligopyrenoides, Strain CCMP3278" /LENGTH=522 /DNA_ID=CAMNT_0024650229 /DNA_START=17 /DNA_END=1585 /DNA_ORIENTATION=+